MCLIWQIQAQAETRSAVSLSTRNWHHHIRVVFLRGNKRGVDAEGHPAQDAAQAHGHTQRATCKPRKSPPVHHCIHYLLLSSVWFPWLSDTYSFSLPHSLELIWKNKQSIPSIRHPIANEARVSRSISHGKHLFLCPIKHFVCNSPATKRILLPLIAQKEKYLARPSSWEVYLAGLMEMYHTLELKKKSQCVADTAGERALVPQLFSCHEFKETGSFQETSLLLLGL